MSEKEVIDTMRRHFQVLFPRQCPKCGRVFPTLREYILSTERRGTTHSYDAAEGNWKPQKPLGAVAFANCNCGTTLGLTTEGMPLDQVHALLEWVHVETQKRGLKQNELIDTVREQIRVLELAEPRPPS